MVILTRLLELAIRGRRILKHLATGQKREVSFVSRRPYLQWTQGQGRGSWVVQNLHRNLYPKLHKYRWQEISLSKKPRESNLMGDLSSLWRKRGEERFREEGETAKKDREEGERKQKNRETGEPA